MRGILRLCAWFMAKTSWIKALLWLGAAEIIYCIMLFVTIPAVEHQGKNMEHIFDMRPLGYSLQSATTLLEDMGEKGRHIYLTNQIPLDLLYPGFMAVSVALFIALFAKRTHRRLCLLIFLPLIASLFDYLENVMVVVMLSSFPNIQQPIVLMASTFTVLKSMLTTSYLVVLFVLFLGYLYQIVRTTRQVQSGKDQKSNELG